MKKYIFPKSKKKHSLSELETVPYEKSIPCFLEQNKELLLGRENVREVERLRVKAATRNIIVGGPLDVCSSTSHSKSLLECNIDFVEERTKKVFERLTDCYNSNGLIDSVKLANMFGFEIEENKGLPTLINGIITCDSNGKQMAINYNLSKDSKRYSIIYLLSTYLIYYQNQDFFIQKHIDSEEDLEASYMARLLLIPQTSLTSKNFDSVDNKELSQLFQVPKNIMDKRIEEHKKLVKKTKRNTGNK